MSGWTECVIVSVVGMVVTVDEGLYERRLKCPQSLLNQLHDTNCCMRPVKHSFIGEEGAFGTAGVQCDSCMHELQLYHTIGAMLATQLAR